MSLQRKIVIALLGVFLLFNGSLPHWVHSFEDHHDTVHAHCSSHEKERHPFSFESSHHHCDYLNLLLPELLSPPAKLVLSHNPNTELQEYRLEASIAVTSQLLPQLCLRGPPQILVL